MLFNSFSFLVFIVIVVPLFYLLSHKYRWLLLLIASCFFYAFYIPAYLLVLFAIITIDYFAAIQIEKAKPEHKKKYLLLSLFGNLSILFFFKYYNFFIDNINQLTIITPFIKTRLTHLDIILPIGLSFHTFQAISYIVEVYKGNQKSEKHYGIYALYVMFFPQLVAGPIERPQNMLHQFHNKNEFDFNNIASGVRYILWGLFMKAVIADRLAIPVDTVFNNPGGWSGLCVIFATLFFAMQIYCDFAGYSYMALGIARLMGFKLIFNFRQPYFSKNIGEFWTRWHISLSTWFKDYVYIPLGGNRVGQSKMFFNLFIVFSLSGLWHGASWTFVAWGLFHCLLMIACHTYKKYIPQIKISNAIATIVTFTFVCLGWIFFRAKNMHDAKQLLGSIFHFSRKYISILDDGTHGIRAGILGLPVWSFMYCFFLIPIFLYLDYYVGSGKAATIKTKSFFIRWCVYNVMIVIIFLFGIFGFREFIYFKF